MPRSARSPTESCHGVGHQDLAAGGLGGHTRREDHGATEEVVALADHLTDVRSHPNPDRADVEPELVVLVRTLEGYGARDGCFASENTIM